MINDTNPAFLSAKNNSVTSLHQYSRASNEQTEEGGLTLGLVSQTKAQTTRNSDMKVSQGHIGALVSVPVSNRRNTTYIEVSVETIDFIFTFQIGASQNQDQQQYLRVQLQDTCLPQQLSVVKVSVKPLAKHHRRKSSERFVTNEGARKAIRDFNVFEMQGRKMAAHSMKNLPKNIHQTKRNTNTKYAQNQPVQAKSKKIVANVRKQSSSSCKAAESTLPRTEQVDDLMIKPAISLHKFSSSLYGTMLSELSPGQKSAQYVIARRAMSPRTGISVATINLTGADYSENKKRDLSELESPSQFLSNQQLDESN